MAGPHEGAISYAYEVVDPYERGVSVMVVLDQPVRVGERLRRAFTKTVEDPNTNGITITSGPERDWEVVAIEPTDRDGRRVSSRSLLMREKNPIMQGRLVLRPLA